SRATTRPTTWTTWTCSTPWRPTSPGIPTGTRVLRGPRGRAREQVPGGQVPVYDRPGPGAGGAVPGRPGGHGGLVGGRAGQPAAPLHRRGGHHLAGVHRGGAGRAGRAGPRGPVPAGRAPVPDPDPVDRDVRAGLRRAARHAARLRGAAVALQPALPGHHDLRPSRGAQPARVAASSALTVAKADQAAGVRARGPAAAVCGHGGWDHWHSRPPRMPKWTSVLAAQP